MVLLGLMMRYFICIVSFLVGDIMIILVLFWGIKWVWNSNFMVGIINDKVFLELVFVVFRILWLVRSWGIDLVWICIIDLKLDWVSIIEDKKGYYFWWRVIIVEKFIILYFVFNRILVYLWVMDY